jgi:protocatechuate 3,4-dioxygenase beta subunit
MEQSMSSGSRTKAYGLVALAVLALGLWWWLGRDRGGAGEGEGEGNGSDAAGASASADALRPVPLRGKALDPWQAPRAVVSGTVRDEQGNPIAGAQVCGELQDESLAGIDRRPPQCTTTREDGTYRLEELLGAEHDLFASAPGHLPARYRGRRGIQDELSGRVELRAGSERTGIDFVLKAGGVEVTGVIKDLAGGEIEGAFVSASSGAWGEDGRSFTRSDAEGRFSVWVATPRAWISAFADGYTEASREAAVPGTFVEVFLVPESVVVGKVVWAGSGTPVAGAEVSTSSSAFFSGSGSTTTDADGTFRLEGLEPGSHKLHVSGDELTGMSDQKVHVGLGQTSEPVVVVVHPAFAVRGTVLVDGKTPCSFGRVRLQDEAHKTDGSRGSHGREDGTVLVQGVLPGTYEVSVSCDGFVAQDAYPDVVVVDASLEGLTWSVSAGRSIRGVVVDAAGKPVAGAHVSARARAGAGDPRGRRTGAWGERTEADGSFAVTGLLPGSYELAIDHHDHVSPPEPSAVELPEDRDLEGIELALLASGKLGGIVRDEKGAAVSGVSVSLVGPRRGSATTNDAGRFEIAAVAVGEHRVIARRGWSDTMRAPGATDDDAAGERVEVRAGEVTEVELVVESQDGRITGRVVAEGGEPVADAFVEAVRESDSAAAASGGSRSRVRWGSWSRQPVLTDEDGRFVLEDLAEQGAYTILAHRKGGGEAVTEHVSAGSDVELAIEQTGVLAGVVRLEGGGMPTRFSVSAVDRAAGIRESDTFFETSGAWRLTNLPPGKFEVSVDAAEGNAKTDVELAEGAEKTDVELVLAPRVTLEGRLVDATTGEPVPGLKVSAGTSGGSIAFRSDNKPNQEDVSDAQGRFVIEDAPTGKVRIFVTSPGMSRSDYGWTNFTRRVASEPAVQDLGTIELLEDRVARGEETGDFGLKIKQVEPTTEPEDVRRVIAFVRPGGPAEAAGLAAGEEIVVVDGQEVTGVESYRYEKLMRVPPGTTVKLGVMKGDVLRAVEITAGPPV